MLNGNIHFSLNAVSRSQKQSSTGRAAYQLGVGRFTYKAAEVVAVALVGQGAVLSHDKQCIMDFWCANDNAHKRKDAIVSRSVDLALPLGASLKEWKALTEKICAAISKKYNVTVSYAIHDEYNNPHAHLLITSKQCDGKKFGCKAKEFDATEWAHRGVGPNAVETSRAMWAGIINTYFANAKRHERVDHRSYWRRGLDIQPTAHIGPRGKISALREKGIMQTRNERYNAAVMLQRETSKELLNVTTQPASTISTTGTTAANPAASPSVPATVGYQQRPPEEFSGAGPRHTGATGAIGGGRAGTQAGLDCSRPEHGRGQPAHAGIAGYQGSGGADRIPLPTSVIVPPLLAPRPWQSLQGVCVPTWVLDEVHALHGRVCALDRRTDPAFHPVIIDVPTLPEVRPWQPGTGFLAPRGMIEAVAQIQHVVEALDRRTDPALHPMSVDVPTLRRSKPWQSLCGTIIPPSVTATARQLHTSVCALDALTSPWLHPLALEVPPLRVPSPPASLLASQDRVLLSAHMANGIYALAGQIKAIERKLVLSNASAKRSRQYTFGKMLKGLGEILCNEDTSPSVQALWTWKDNSAPINPSSKTNVNESSLETFEMAYKPQNHDFYRTREAGEEHRAAQATRRQEAERDSHMQRIHHQQYYLEREHSHARNGIDPTITTGPAHRTETSGSVHICPSG